ncbi:MAG: hypothetical protein ACUVWR_07385 [Anaerolineae bacterium]
MHFSEFQHLTHLIGTTSLVSLYLLRLYFLLRHKVAPDRAPDPKGNLVQGVIWSLLILVTPWRMESSSKHWTRYVEFIIFHIAIFLNILTSFLLTYTPGIMGPPVNYAFVLFLGLGLIAGLFRIVRRFNRPEMRIISSFDDYFSMILVLLFLFTGMLALLGLFWAIVIYFVIAAFFLLYEPLSKIRHYLYYPFGRIFFGTDFGRRGVLK